MFSFDEFIDNLIIKLLGIYLKTFLGWLNPIFM